jgi:hypothetical protein
MTVVSIRSHIGRTYASDAAETLNGPSSTIASEPLKYQSNSGPTSSLPSAMKPSADTTACISTVPMLRSCPSY